MNRTPIRHSLLAAAVAALLAVGTVTQVQAQSPSEDASRRAAERGSKKAGKQDELYPNATRQSPEAKSSAKARPKLQKMLKLYEDDEGAEARALADEIIAAEGYNDYDRAFASQLASQIAYENDDFASAIAYMAKAIEYDALDNGNHFNALLMLGQLQVQDEKLAEGLATIDRFLKESGSTKPEHLALKGQTLYQLERYEESAAVFKQLVDSTSEPKNEWLSLLMGSYSETGKTAEAVQLAEQIAAKKPDDKQAQMNLATMYSQAEMFDKAAAAIEKIRAAGKLTEDRDYRVLYSMYLNLEGKEKEAAAVISEGLQKGILKPDHQAYLALAQSYYVSEQPEPAIEAYRKAAPLDDDGETYLNLARLLWQENRIAEAKAAAKQAIAKGLKKPDDAKKILALPAR